MARRMATFQRQLERCETELSYSNCQQDLCEKNAAGVYAATSGELGVGSNIILSEDVGSCTLKELGGTTQTDMTW
jgi:hypothetical protein